jgi:hypothetical protein
MDAVSDLPVAWKSIASHCAQNAMRIANVKTFLTTCTVCNPADFFLSRGRYVLLLVGERTRSGVGGEQ